MNWVIFIVLALLVCALLFFEIRGLIKDIKVRKAKREDLKKKTNPSSDNVKTK